MGNSSYTLWDGENRKLIRSNDVGFNEVSIVSQNQHKIVGKKVSLEIDTDAIEGPTHRIELALRQTPEDNLGSDTPTKFDSAKGLQDKLNSFRRLTRGERNRVEMAQSPRQAKVLKN